MWVKQCHKPPICGMVHTTTYENGDGWRMVYGIVLPTVYFFLKDGKSCSVIIYITTTLVTAVPAHSVSSEVHTQSLPILSCYAIVVNPKHLHSKWTLTLNTFPGNMGLWNLCNHMSSTASCSWEAGRERRCLEHGWDSVARGATATLCLFPWFSRYISWTFSSHRYRILGFSSTKSVASISL